MCYTCCNLKNLDENTTLNFLGYELPIYLFYLLMWVVFFFSYFSYFPNKLQILFIKKILIKQVFLTTLFSIKHRLNR